jgi:hypothetical protein
MQWSDVVKPPPTRTLRQFAGLFLVVFLVLAAWRWWGGRPDGTAIVLAAAALLVGIPGLIVPSLVRPVFTGWMIAAFPIGWTISRVVLGVVFYGVVTPLAFVFRTAGRDVLRLRRRSPGSYWLAKRQPDSASDYFRQF